MTDGGRAGGKRAEAAISAAVVRDATVLRRALLNAVSTSPDSFMMTIEDVIGRPFDYWVNEIRSSTWAVAQRGVKEVVGVVACRLPDLDKDLEDQEFTRYIESAWIAPELRRKGLGTRLINFLLEMEYRKNQQIRQFLLWVYAANSPAIQLYKHIGFSPTRESQLLLRNGQSKAEVEIKYCLNFDATVHTSDEDARRHDRHMYGVTYRVLGERESG